MTIYGAPRLTDDVDLLVPAADIENAKRVVATVGFDVPARPMQFGADTPNPRTVHRASKLDEEGELLSLDLLVVAGPLEAV